MPDIEPIQNSPRSADEDVRRIFVGLPTFEVREIERWTAAFPVAVTLQTRSPVWVGVTAAETDDQEATVNASQAHYYVSEGGITITNIAGLSAGTEYDLAILVIGARA